MIWLSVIKLSFLQGETEKVLSSRQ